MKLQKVLVLAIALAVMGAGAGWILQFRAKQRLGPAGVKTSALSGQSRVRVELPEHVLDYNSEFREQDKLVMEALPQDTSYGARLYKEPDGHQLLMSVVLMGRDRSSMHKPQMCLEGAGWRIDYDASTTTTIHVDKPAPYDLPVVKIVATREDNIGGQRVVSRGLYVYWFVADDALSATVSGFQRMWMMSKQMMLTGVLQRWAYVSCLGVCAPGQEDAEYERMKSFIAASVPDFQLTPKAPGSAVASK